MIELQHEILVFIGQNCSTCKEVLDVLQNLLQNNIVRNVEIIDRSIDVNRCKEYGVCIFPATFVNRRLVFYGVFAPEDMQQLLYAKT